MTKVDKNLGDVCMGSWVNENKGAFKEYFANINGELITNFSEVLALAPYVLRAIRI